MVANCRIGTLVGNGGAVTVEVDRLRCFHDHLLLGVGVVVGNIISKHNITAYRSSDEFLTGCSNGRTANNGVVLVYKLESGYIGITLVNVHLLIAFLNVYEHGVLDHHSRVGIQITNDNTGLLAQCADHAIVDHNTFDLRAICLVDLDGTGSAKRAILDDGVSALDPNAIPGCSLIAHRAVGQGAVAVQHNSVSKDNIVCSQADKLKVTVLPRTLVITNSLILNGKVFNGNVGNGVSGAVARKGDGGIVIETNQGLALHQKSLRIFVGLAAPVVGQITLDSDDLHIGIGNGILKCFVGKNERICIECILVISLTKAVLFLCKLRSKEVNAEFDRGNVGAVVVRLIADGLGHIDSDDHVMSIAYLKLLLGCENVARIEGFNGTNISIGSSVKDHIKQNIAIRIDCVRNSGHSKNVGKNDILIILSLTYGLANNVHIGSVLQSQRTVVGNAERNDLGVAGLPKSLLEQIVCTVKIFPFLTVERVLDNDVQITGLDDVAARCSAVREPRECRTKQHREAKNQRQNA